MAKIHPRRVGVGSIIYLPKPANKLTDDPLYCENPKCKDGKSSNICHLDQKGFSHPVIVLSITETDSIGYATEKSNITFVQVNDKLFYL